jgi:hypothetical protein
MLRPGLPTLRHHDGRFYVFVCTPYDGLFMWHATDPRTCERRVARAEPDHRGRVADAGAHGQPKSSAALRKSTPAK